ncbi:MAG: hydroxymethylglutaryl-CoA reductase, degradative [Thaumarchaeota archaeon]|nr:hydroxymethylglutaryl-CoA reductase, degradative [Nitrososphaerota archaeon]
MNEFSKFFKKNKMERLHLVKNFSKLTKDELLLLEKLTNLEFQQADQMIENAIGTFSLPLGIATNFRINDKDYIIPMVIEEPSIIAASSKAAKIANIKGGFKAKSSTQYSMGQIYINNCNLDIVTKQIMKNKNKILQFANSKTHTLSKIKKGAKNISCREINVDGNQILVVEILVDVGNAMGANITNSMCEKISPLIEKITGGNSIMKILTNYYTSRMVTSSAIFDKKQIGGEEVVNKILLAYKIAMNDKYRAVTHNKGIMNGIISISNATCQDTRAIEAAAHAFAAQTGKYLPLTTWKKNQNNDLVGSIKLPLSVGTIGGIINVHPMAKLCLKILRVKSAKTLSCIIASVGLAQNFAALYALVTDGIQKGHMKLHAKNLAVAAGVKFENIDVVVNKMIQEDDISINNAKKLQKLFKN